MSILFMMERNLSNFWKCLIFHYSTVCITQKIVLKAKDLIKIYFIIHEGKKPVKFVTLSILKRGPKIDMSILFMMERNLSNFWKCLIFHYSTVCITQKIVLKAKDLIKIYSFIHEGKKPVKFITLSMSNFWKVFLQSLHLCLFFALKGFFLCYF